MVWPKTRPGPAKRDRIGLKSGPAQPELATWYQCNGLKHGPARVGPMDGSAFEVSKAMDGWRQLRNDWLHHACVARRQVVCI